MANAGARIGKIVIKKRKNTTCTHKDDRERCIICSKPRGYATNLTFTPRYTISLDSSLELLPDRFLIPEISESCPMKGYELFDLSVIAEPLSIYQADIP